MVLVGLLLTRNEGDIIREVMADHLSQFDAIIASDGSDPGEGTWEALDGTNEPKILHRQFDGPPRSEHLRGILYERAAEWIDRYHGGQGWVFPIQGDEIYHHRIRSFVERAERERAKVLNCWVADFVLHPTERDRVWEEDPGKSIRTRRRWCFVNHQEHCGFRHGPGIWWPKQPGWSKTAPEGIDKKRWCSAAPLRLHFPFRHPVQSWLRVLDRTQSGVAARWEWALKSGSVFTDVWPEDGSIPMPLSADCHQRFLEPFPRREMSIGQHP